MHLANIGPDTSLKPEAPSKIYPGWLRSTETYDAALVPSSLCINLIYPYCLAHFDFAKYLQSSGSNRCNSLTVVLIPLFCSPGIRVWIDRIRYLPAIGSAAGVVVQLGVHSC